MRRSLSRILADLATADPDRVVVVDEDGPMTAGEVDLAATRLAHELIARGVRTDDLVTVTLPNGRGFVVACCAVWRSGATPLPVTTDRSTAQRAAIAEVARPRVAIGMDAGADVPRIADPAAVVGRDDPLPDVWARSWKAPTSSGSTGRPKVVLAAGPALLDPEAPVAPFVPRSAVQLVSGPLAHSAVFTYAMRGLLLGHRLVVLPRFDAVGWVEAVRAHAVTWALLVPTTMHRLMRLDAAQRTGVGSLETVLHMGARCAPDLKRAFLGWLGPERVVEVYAGSESNGLTMIRGDEWLAHPGSVGRPIGGTEIEIRRSGGGLAAAGETGEVWMRRGAEPAYAYLGARSRREASGWDTLGDLGFVEPGGWLHLVDRADDVIVRGAEKIYPAEVEHVLEAHPAVRGAVVVGLPDDELGMRVGAVVDAGDGEVEAGELRAWAAERLDRARVPEVWSLQREPVRGDAGKTNRRAWAARLGG